MASDDFVKPNGIAFSPDESKLYVVEWRGTPNRSIWSFDVAADGSVSNKTKLIDAADQGALDGFKVDRDGNLWCGWGSNGALEAEPRDVGGRKVHELRGRSEELDGVMVFNPQGKAIEGALKTLGVKGVASVRQGKVFDIELKGKDRKAATAALKAAADKLLANTVIENYRVEKA